MGIIKKLFEATKTTELDEISMDQFRERQKFVEDNYAFHRSNFHPTMDQRLLQFHEDPLKNSSGH